jgi:uncharacterized pyridoxamine 5'-phosphate oxidase family protein
MYRVYKVSKSQNGFFVKLIDEAEFVDKIVDKIKSEKMYGFNVFAQYRVYRVDEKDIIEIFRYDYQCNPVTLG